MAKSKNKRKNTNSLSPKLSLKSYIRKAVRKLPIYECRAYSNWKEEGKTQVFAARQKANGNLIVGFYLIDLWCLGLKDTFYRELSVFEYEEIVQKTDEQMSREMGTNFIKIEPDLAYNIIYGAIEYAEDLGFAPNKDFSITEYILNDVEKIPFIDIEFGNEGKPFYVPGPDDNSNKVLRTLEKNVGSGKYHFLMDVRGMF